jgi:hypothetical protein
MAMPDGVDFDEVEIQGCCGMSELQGIRRNENISFEQVGKRLCEWLDTHGNIEDNPDQFYDWKKNKYVPRTPETQSLAHGRRLVITSLRNGQKKLIEGLTGAGWFPLTEFPGNHGNYKLTLLGYIPQHKINEAWFNNTLADDDGSGDEDDYEEEEDYDDDF